MAKPGHTDWWTRRRTSQLSRRVGGISGAGLSKAVLEGAARRLGYSLTFAPRSGQDYDEAVTLGPWRGNIHDECFVDIESEDARLRDALLAAVVEMHSPYFGPPLDARCVAALQNELTNGVTLRLRSVAEGLVVKRYRNGAGWWERFTTPAKRVCA